MKQPTIPSLALAGALAFSALCVPSASAQSNDALLDALVQKKVLTVGEAESIRADLINERAESDNSKIVLSKSLTELKIGGDVRYRYQWENVKQRDLNPAGPSPGFPNHGEQRSRQRFRFRLNADFKLTDQFFGGMTVQTGESADSSNVTFGNGFSNFDIYLSRIFVGWQPTDGATFLIGKMNNPFYTTDLVWDGDINPEGLAEIIDFHKLFGGGGVEEVTTTTADGKEVVTSTSTVSREPNWFLSLRGGQFIYSENRESRPDNDDSIDAWLFATQLVGGYKFNKDTKITVAPGFMIYNASSIGDNASVRFYNDGTVGTGAARDLHILTAPGDLQFKIAGVKTKLLWDFAYNFQGRPRARKVYGMSGNNGNSAYNERDSFAWLAGFQLGENKKKGDLSLIANYRQIGLAAVDPNLNDSDFALTQVNSQGFKVGLAYNLTDFAVLGATYINSSRLRKDLIGGQATGGNAIASNNSADVFQFDLNVKF